MSQQAQETVVPTEEMIRVGAWRAKLHREANPGDTWEGTVREVFSVMVAAAPVSPDSALLKEAVGLLKEYRDKTPLGHQPHMIAARADAFLSKVEERGHD